MAISHPCAFRQSESFPHLIKFELIVVPKYLKNIEKVITFQVKKSLEDVTPAETTSLWTSNKMGKQTTGLWTKKQPSCEHQTKWRNRPLVCEQTNNQLVNIKQTKSLWKEEQVNFERNNSYFVKQENNDFENKWTMEEKYQIVCEKNTTWFVRETKSCNLWTVKQNASLANKEKDMNRI